MVPSTMGVNSKNEIRVLELPSIYCELVHYFVLNDLQSDSPTANSIFFM